MDEFFKYLFDQFYTSHTALPSKLYLNWPLRVHTTTSKTELIKRWQLENGQIYDYYEETTPILQVPYTFYYLVHNNRAIYANAVLLDYERVCKEAQFKLELDAILKE